MVVIRREEPADADAIRDVHDRAFGQPDEGRLVDELRAAGKAVASLVAVDGGRVVGHILFSPVSIESADTSWEAVGLAPMAVLPERWRTGIGSRLVERGLEECRRAGYGRVVVLGHAEYYPRFGFVPASRFGVGSDYDVPDEVFMARELEPGAFRGCSGTARFQPEFAGV